MVNPLKAFIAVVITARLMRQGLARRWAMPLTVLLLGGNAFAATNTIVATGVDWNRGQSIWLREDGSDVQAYFAGVIFISLYDTGSNRWDRDTLCVDLFTDISINVTYGTTLLHPSDVTGKNLSQVSWLVDNALLPTQTNLPSALPASDWVTNSAQGAGIQLAIWDIVHDNGDGFNAGRLQLSGDAAHPTPADVLAWAVTYETLSLNKTSDLAYVYQNVTLADSVTAQMLAGPEFVDNGPLPVPEPSTWQLVLVSLACGVGVRFSRRR